MSDELQLIELIESTSTLKDNILKDVLILGAKSTNNRVYTSDAMREAIPLYESACVYINHNVMANGDRPLEDRFGTAKNIRLTDKGLIGDIEVLTTHPLYAMIRESYDNKTTKIGCSHDVVGSGVTDANGTTIIDKIHKVRSIDIISGTATTKNLRESENAQLVELQESNKELKAVNKELVDKVNLLETEINSLKEKANKWQVPTSMPLQESKKEELKGKELAQWLCS